MIPDSSTPNALASQMFLDPEHNVLAFCRLFSGRKDCQTRSATVHLELDVFAKIVQFTPVTDKMHFWRVVGVKQISSSPAGELGRNISPILFEEYRSFYNVVLLKQTAKVCATQAIFLDIT